METDNTILNLVVLFWVIVASSVIWKQSKENDKLQKELDEKKAECKFWKNQLKNYLS